MKAIILAILLAASVASAQWTPAARESLLHSMDPRTVLDAVTAFTRAAET